METVLAKRQNKKGFTLVELVIVIAVLAILAAIAIPTVTNVINSANANVDASNAQTIELALKTADSEIQAKTWDGTTKTQTTAMTHDTLTVAVALEHQGLTIPDTKVSGNKFVYSNGKVTAATTGTEIAADTLVKTVLGN